MQMRYFIRFILVLGATLLAVSCGIPPGGFTPPPLVMLWDKVPADIEGDKALRLALFHADGTRKEFDFAPQWSTDAFVHSGSHMAAFNGGEEPLSLDETLRCFDTVSGEEMFAKTEGQWAPLGFIEEGWALVAMKRETRFQVLHEGDKEFRKGNFTGRGYRLKYTVYLIDVLTGEPDEGMVIYDAGSDRIRWEDKAGFEPVLASDAGLLFAALPDFPYITDEIGNDMRSAKLWKLDLRSGEVHKIDLDGAVRKGNFQFLVSADGRSVFYQSQAEGETVSLRMKNYGDSLREWGSLYIFRDGEITPIAPLDGKHVRHQMGINRRGDVLLYAEVEYDAERKEPIEGTLALYINDHTGRGEMHLPIDGDVWNVSLSPGGRWVGYLINEPDGLQLRLLDTARMKDVVLAECGPYSRFYGFACAGRGDIAIPHMDRMLFGFPNPVAKL